MQDIQIQIAFWKKSAQRSFDAARVLFENKHYDHCLFFCHLSLEKLLKGLVVKNTKKPAPYIHDLAHLANLAKLEIEKGQIENLRIITTFNISGRYQEDKYAFYKKCDKKYSEDYLKISKKLFLWLKKEYQKK